jgi:hypothetical protein
MASAFTSLTFMTLWASSRSSAMYVDLSPLLPCCMGIIFLGNTSKHQSDHVVTTCMQSFWANDEGTCDTVKERTAHILRQFGYT